MLVGRQKGLVFTQLFHLRFRQWAVRMDFDDACDSDSTNKERNALSDVWETHLNF